MKKTVYLALAVAMALVACNHYDDLQKNGKESKAGSSESHNEGQNCMRCHNDGEFSEAVLSGGWWNVAGTAYNLSGKTVSEGTVELWTGPNRTGEKVYSLPIDNKGNFYTAKIVNFKGGVYPVLIKKDGSFSASMGTKTTSAACNSCHDGTTQARVTFY